MQTLRILDMDDVDVGVVMSVVVIRLIFWCESFDANSLYS
jgi:hypothetical protein